MKYILIIFLSILYSSVYSQSIIKWKGGTPGKESKWDEPKNWSTYSIPNEFSNVIIPDVSTSTFAYPILTKGVVELNSIAVESNATLIIEAAATMIVHDAIIGWENQRIVAKGTIVFPNGFIREDNSTATAVNKY